MFIRPVSANYDRHMKTYHRNRTMGYAEHTEEVIMEKGRTIERATTIELPEILKIYEAAKEIMIKAGNPNQWTNGYPQSEVLLNDISRGNLYVVKEDGVICAAFALVIGAESNYEKIENGKLLYGGEYGTIHRVASNGKYKGIFADITTFCEDKIGHLRIDTHEDNVIMKKLIERNGFKKCGIILIK